MQHTLLPACFESATALVIWEVTRQACRQVGTTLKMALSSRHCLQGITHQILHAIPSCSCAFSCRVGSSPISRVTLVAAFHRSQEAEAARAKILAERALRRERAEHRAQESQASREGGGVNVSLSGKSLPQRSGVQRSRPGKRELLWLYSCLFRPAQTDCSWGCALAGNWR